MHDCWLTLQPGAETSPRLDVVSAR